MGKNSDKDTLFNKENSVEVIVGGKKISLRGDGSRDYLLKVADYVNSKISELIKLDPQLESDREKLFILVAINLTDELFKQNYFSDKKGKILDYPHIERVLNRVKDIISNIDNNL